MISLCYSGSNGRRVLSRKRLPKGFSVSSICRLTLGIVFYSCDKDMKDYLRIEGNVYRIYGLVAKKLYNHLIKEKNSAKKCRKQKSSKPFC